MSTQKKEKNVAPMSYEEYQKKVASLKTAADVSNFARELVAPLLEEVLEAEMTAHVGYEKHDPAGNNSGNSRNGYRSRMLKGSFGEAELDIPRDRNGTFAPQVLPEGSMVNGDLEEKVISLYTSGLSVRDISQQLSDLYKVEVSGQFISLVTEKVIPHLQSWQQRPLDRLYPVMYCDGIHFKVRHNGKIVGKTVYTILAINQEGNKELVGLWIAESEGAKFWLQVLTELNNRGVEDVLIMCVDGLTGFGDAIRTVFPNTVVQRCIVHQIRATTKYCNWKDRKGLCRDLKTVYTAPTAEAGFEALQQVKVQWPQYTVYLEQWEKQWHEISPFFEFGPDIRRMIYTTNIIENVHRQFRKATKTTTIFPNDQAVLKRLYLVQDRMSKKWNMRAQNWGQVIAQLAIHFPERFTI